jgi:hypothetical protein
MANDRDDSTDDDNGDKLSDFEQMLREKDKQWTTPPQEMKPSDLVKTPNLDEHFEITPVEGVVENSSEKPKSNETIESTPQEQSTSADVVESAGDEPSGMDEKEQFEYDKMLDSTMLERGTEIKLHNHPISGPWTSDESVAWRYDPEAIEIFRRLRQLAVSEAPLEAIIERTNRIERSVKLLRIGEQGLRSGIAERLSKMRDSDRRTAEKMISDGAKKNQTMTQVLRKRKKSGAEPVKVKVEAESKSKSMKFVDTMKKNGEDKEGVIELLKTTKRLDAQTLAYIEKLKW